MAIEIIKEVIEWAILLPVRIRHKSRARRKHRARASAILTTRRTLAGARGLNAQNTQAVFNVGLYLLLLDLDLADFTDDMVCAIGDRRRRFVAKHEAVLLYEAAEDLPQLLGREFRDAAKSLGANSDQQSRLNEASSGLNRFWREHREFLGDIRTTLAAHREHDALVYAEKLDSLKPLEIMRLGAQFSEHLERLISVLVELATLTHGIPAILGDMKRSRSSP